MSNLGGKAAAGLCLAAMSVLVASGCGGGGSGDSAPSGASGATTADFEDAALKFARCMRKHGVNVPDPQTSSQGGFAQGVQIDAPSKQLERANKACEGLLPPVPQQTPEQREEMTEAALANAKCMREHGIDFPDPTVGENGVIQMLLPDPVVLQSPAFAKASKECGGGAVTFGTISPADTDG